MPPAQPHPFALYNPALLPADVLLAEYTARLPLLETLLGIVRGNAPGHPPQHALLIGARGMGKTTTLWAVAHRIARDPKLAAQWQPVVFDEESRRVGDLADFWLESIRQWEFATGDTAPDRAGKLLTENPPNIEDRAFDVFTSLVQRSGRRALLLIDNLNNLFSSIREAAPLHRLRATLMQDSGIMLIGGATAYFDQVTSIDQPFFDFFRNFELKPLTLEEMQDCLQTLARTRGDHAVEKALTERQGSIHALHILTGGNPRLIRTFYRLLREGLHTDIRADLERLLDEFTPYFKSIIDPLPGQQQRIFDAVALAWNPVEVATLATATRLPSNQVSAQLRSLVKSGLLRETAGPPRKKTYLLADRFSNIHYLMRHGRAARNRLDWFVATIRVLFPDQINELIARLAADSAGHGLPGQQDARDVLHSALIRSETAASRRDLLHCTLRETWSAPAMEKLGEWFDVERAKVDLPEIDILAFCSQMPAALRKELGFKPDKARWWLGLTDFLEKREAWDLSEAAYRKAIELDPNDGALWHALGNFLRFNSQRYLEAETVYRKAIELNPNSAWSWIGLGKLFEVHHKRFAAAEAAYRTATKLAPTLDWSWYDLGNLLFAKLNRPTDAEVALRNAIDIDDSNVFSHLSLARMLDHRSNGKIESRKHLVAALLLEPKPSYVRALFLSHCEDHAENWAQVLPSLGEWCVRNPKEDGVFEFTVDGLVRFARLTTPAQALEILAGLPDAAPFESVKDALIACADPEHLHRLAPERQSVAMELMRRLKAPAT